MTPRQFKAARKTLGLSQQRLGIRIGRTVRQIIRYEMGDATIPIIAELAMQAIVSEHEAKAAVEYDMDIVRGEGWEAQQ